MLKLIISGVNGRMGKVLTELIGAREDMEIIAGVDKANTGEAAFPIYSTLSVVQEEADCIIDFSHPALLGILLDYSLDHKTPLVLSTTGYDLDGLNDIMLASEKIPLFFSANMSLGVNLLTELAKKAASVLGTQFDIEIIEKHHNQKVDSPSGTALMVADSINSVSEGRYKYAYNRPAVREKRNANEIGIHPVRGGTIVGEHEVIFAGEDEIITISHSAMSRKVFATGALNAAVFLAKQKPGLYTMANLI